MGVIFGRNSTTSLNRGVNIVIPSDKIVTGPVGPQIQGPLPAGAGLDTLSDVYIGWNDPPNAASTTLYATSNEVYYDYVYTNYIQTYDFGFSIPLTATIDGIEVKINAKDNIGDATQFGNIILYKGEYGVGTNFGQKAGDAYVLTTSDNIITLGGPTDNWGGTITPADINDYEFSVVYNFFTVASFIIISTNNISVKVYYT
jgi:hypothetical protein